MGCVDSCKLCFFFRCGRRRSSFADLGSIREFCDVQTPIIMFDKDGNFAVAWLKEVSQSVRQVELVQS